MKDTSAFKIEFNRAYYIINNESFYNRTKPEEYMITGVYEEYTQYYWVIPMYVYSINKLYDGRETFDLCPVNMTSESPKTSWKWRRSFEYDEINKNLFLTEEEAWSEYNRKFNEEERKLYEISHDLKFYNSIK